MSQSLLDDQPGAPEDDNAAQFHHLEKTVETLNCELALLRQHMDSGFALVRSDIAARFAEADLRTAERFAAAAQRQDDNMKALTCQLQAQIVESERRQEIRMIELSRRQDAFSRWMAGTTIGIVVLIANMASRYF